MYIAAGVIGGLALVSIAWRFGSRRRSIPCPVWLRWLVEHDNPFAKTSHAAVIVEHLALRPGMTVIDVGCGPGRVTIPIAQALGAQGQVIAVDLQPGMLARARAKAQAANLTNIRFVEAGAGEGKFAHAGADRALLVTVLGEIPDRRAALQEIYAALVPGGILSITEIIFDPHFQSRGTVSRLTAAVGFREAAFFGNRFAYTLNLEKPL
jgi:ubiquinone/menaquinone biosynthesis C-methylase UbiE